MTQKSAKRAKVSIPLQPRTDRWFRPRHWGWGLFPRNWKGVGMILLLCVAIAAPIPFMKDSSDAIGITIVLGWTTLIILVAVLWTYHYLKKNYPKFTGWQTNQYKERPRK